MYKTIICAIDATSEGKDVLTKAAELAAKFDSKLFVIHVMPYSVLPKDYQKELKEKISPKLEKLTSSFGINPKQLILKVGKPYDRICVEAEKRKAELIVVGTHSKKGVKALLGSTANGIVNYADCDVTLVKV